MANRLIVASVLALMGHQATAQVALSERTFREHGTSMGVVILQVNWGRYWGCGPYENAQLQRLAFRRLAVGDAVPEKDWELSPTSTLLAGSSFKPYVFLLDPGEYAISGIKFKVAASTTDVRVAEVGPSELIVDGKPTGGSFTVAAGEAVYIGHFGVDCNGEPTPWRFYIERKQDFDEYVEGFRKQYRFAKDLPISYRLFQTERLGQPYELPK